MCNWHININPLSSIYQTYSSSNLILFIQRFLRNSIWSVQYISSIHGNLFIENMNTGDSLLHFFIMDNSHSTLSFTCSFCQGFSITLFICWSTLIDFDSILLPIYPLLYHLLYHLSNYYADSLLSFQTLKRYSRMLEEGSFRSNAIDYTWMLTFGSTAILLLSTIASQLTTKSFNFLANSLSHMMIYVWARRNPHARMNFLGVFNVCQSRSFTCFNLCTSFTWFSFHSFLFYNASLMHPTYHGYFWDSLICYMEIYHGTIFLV